MSGARRKSGNARAAADFAQMQLLAPAVMAGRLAGLRHASPVQAMFEWNRWALEKACVFSLSGLALAHASAQAAFATLAAGKRAPSALHMLELGGAIGGKALAPLQVRVRRNARRGR